MGLAAVAAIAAAACDSRQYVYEPAVSSNATIAGRPASYYQIPPEAPRGDVRIATFGLVDITPERTDDELRGLHIRMIVTNNSDTPWTVDTREQRAVLPGGGESRPAFAKVDDGAPPTVEIPAGAKRTFDLFFPLPPSMEEARELPSFDTIWTVRTSGGAVVQRTPFERLDVTPVYNTPPAYYYGGYYGGHYGWGPPYYYDPWYGRGGAFVGVHLTPSYVNRPVIIHRHPTAPPGRRVR
jgi:hypothetical protein